MSYPLFVCSWWRSTFTSKASTSQSASFARSRLHPLASFFGRYGLEFPSSSFERLIMKLNLFARLSALSLAAFAATQASAQSTGITAALDAVDLSTVVTAVGAAALVVVAIALVFKGPDVAKRVIKKV
jgi:hypothetical protein